jgi:hypothetical protein
LLLRERRRWKRDGDGGCANDEPPDKGTFEIIHATAIYKRVIMPKAAPPSSA